MSVTTDVPEAAYAAATEFLLSLADDEFVWGHRLSEWVARGPTMEEDNTLASMSQDEFGHARLFYEYVAEALEGDLDELALNRHAGERLNTRLVEVPHEDFADAVAINFLYDAAERLMLESIADGAASVLTSYAAQALAEEPFHREHADAWLDRLVATEEGRDRLERAFAAAIPRAADYFAFDEDAVAVLVEAGVLSRSLAPLRREWIETVRTRLADLPIEVDDALESLDDAPERNGRAGQHTDALKAMIDEMHPEDFVGDYPIKHYTR